MSSGGVVNRTSVREISSQGRDATGVRIMTWTPTTRWRPVGPHRSHPRPRTDRRLRCPLPARKGHAGQPAIPERPEGWVRASS